MEIKILNWNVYNKNKSYLKIFEFLKNSNADIICLQEVSEKLLDMLKQLNDYRIFNCLDFYESKIPCYIVTLIRKDYPAQFALVPLHLNPNVSKQGLKSNWVEGLEVMYINITIHKTKLRIYNIHLSAGCNPRIRRKELNKCLQTIDNYYLNILCGDFNTFANPLINSFIGHLFNFSFNDYFTNERSIFISELFKHNLKSIFEKGKTSIVEIISYPIRIKFPLVEDYIIASKQLGILRKQIYLDRLGSDHRSLEAVIEIPG